SPSPTATHNVGEAQLTPDSAWNVAPSANAGCATVVHAVPFHDSSQACSDVLAFVTVVTVVVPATTQNADDVHDTPVRTGIDVEDPLVVVVPSTVVVHVVPFQAITIACPADVPAATQ